MTKIEQRLVSQRWDTEYRAGRYVNESPLPFVDRIISVLTRSGIDGSETGLYVGCGNGRNFVPLTAAGLRLFGLDISTVSLRQLATRSPRIAGSLISGDFLAPPFVGTFSYLVAIQVLQHGLWADAEAYFVHAARLIAPGGYLFVRVNSISTEIAEPHARIEDGSRGGLTVEYRSGPKAGLPVHFYSREELVYLTANDFEVFGEMKEIKTNRTPPRTGFWAQWEGVWKRRSAAKESASIQVGISSN